MVEKISSTQNSIQHSQQNKPKSISIDNSSNPAKPNSSPSSKKQGVVLELGNKPIKAITYQKPGNLSKPISIKDSTSLASSKSVENSHLKAYQNMANAQIKEQAYQTIEYLKESLTNGEEIDEEVKSKARASVSEGGDFSINNTAQRLFDFAIALSGGDESKLKELQESISTAFKEVEEMLGGTLPEISYKTLDKTMELFDEHFKK